MRTEPGASEGAIAEVVKVRETATRLANGDYPEEADHVRVLAGLIGQLAEQVERLTDHEAGLSGGVAGSRSGNDGDTSAVDRAVEEDVTPEEGPADPLNDHAV